MLPDSASSDPLWEIASAFLGYASVTFWIFAQLPQIYTNWQLRSAQDISPLFLCIWLLGDSCNLAACILTHQLPFQTFLATYFVLLDLSLVLQLIYYCTPVSSAEPSDRTPLIQSANPAAATLPRHNPAHGSSAIDGSDSYTPLSICMMLFKITLMLLIPMFIVLSLSTALLQPAIQALGSAVLRLNTGDSALGTWIAYLCAACYLVSRLPQIYRNHQRKSVQGLSIGMFSLAVFGNLSYALSVICKCVPEPWRLQAAFPFILGSMGTIIFDAVILLQCWIYRPHRYLAEEVSFRSS